MTLLHQLVARTARRTPDAVVLQIDDNALTYRQLDEMANRIARWLESHGVGAGDRVGIWLPKSGVAVAAMQAALRLGAAYVPVDPLSPTARGRMILEDCSVRAVVTSRSVAEASLTGSLEGVVCLPVDEPYRGNAWQDVERHSPDALPEPARAENDLAYVLYTSGSTGRPKGVCISHRNALAFIDWSAATLQANETDRFANHAPFHFDLSVLDLYVPFSTGGAVHLVREGRNYAPNGLVEFLDRRQITVWYSVPSVLMLMMDHGGLLDRDAPSLRAVLFAGEPFPIKHLRRLRARWPEKRFLNLYGPTETNVCTAFEVGDLPEGDTRPVPIGTATCGDEVWAIRPDGSRAGVGEEGELMVAGPTVMLGYFGQPSRGDAPYATGDIVRLEPSLDYTYVGRRDHMVKVRGFRVELGEIENALLAHPRVHDAAVITSGGANDVRLVAFLCCLEAPEPSLVEIKKHCADRLPRYMVVDHVRYVAALPRTRNGKVDRAALLARFEEDRHG